MKQETAAPRMAPERAREIASSFDLRELPDDFFVDPYPVYAALRENEPRRAMPDGSLFLSRYADLSALYRDASSFSSDKRVEFGPKYGVDSPLFAHHTTSLVFNDPPRHSRVRRLIMGALTRRAIDDMAPALTRLVAQLLDSIEERGGGDLIADFASAIPVEVIGNLLAIPHADRDPLRAWSLAILGALEPRLTAAQEELGNRAVSEFTTYLRDLVRERRRLPGDPEHDVLTRLILGDATSAGGEQLEETELLQNCVFILNAGHETTTNLIGNALVLLQQWPGARQSLLDDLRAAGTDPAQIESVMGLAVDEVLRFESSNQLGNRRAVTDFNLGQQAFASGSLLTLCIGAANRDPQVFPVPETLDLRRQPNRHLAFGLGIHQCAGLSLARLEGRIAIAGFLQRLPGYQLKAAPQRGRRARFRGFLSAPFSV